jgi:hypothetical protein
MRTSSEPVADIAAYCVLQTEAMQASALFGPLCAFEAPKSRELPAHLEPARAPIRAAKAERLRLTLAAGVAAGLAWTLAVLVIGIAITRDPGPILDFASASTPVFTLGMGGFVWAMNAGVVAPVDSGRRAAWQSALADEGFTEASWTTSCDDARDIGTYRPPRGVGRVFLFDADEGVCFFAGPMGRMAAVGKRIVEATASGAA